MKKILIIDDDEVFVKVIMDSLPKGLYEVIPAENGEEGLKKLDMDKPDIVILDLMMPIMGGLEFLETLKKRKEPNKVPILISSQLSKMNDVSTAITSGMSVGVVGYIIKATQNMDMIIKTIENTLKSNF